MIAFNVLILVSTIRRSNVRRIAARRKGHFFCRGTVQSHGIRRAYKVELDALGSKRQPWICLSLSKIGKPVLTTREKKFEGIGCQTAAGNGIMRWSTKSYHSTISVTLEDPKIFLDLI
jgi:hypothetical protein